MIIRSNRPESHYLVVENSVVRDPNLSYRASGLLLDILSRPDGWRVDSTRLAAARPGKEGRDAVRSALRELEAAGYVRTVKTQDEKGRYSTDHIIYDHPIFNIDNSVNDQVAPETGKPASETDTTETTKPQVTPTTGKPASVDQASVNQASVFQALIEVPRGSTEKKNPPLEVCATETGHAAAVVEGGEITAEKAKSILRDIASAAPELRRLSAPEKRRLLDACVSRLDAGVSSKQIRDAISERSVDGVRDPAAVYIARICALRPVPPSVHVGTPAGCSRSVYAVSEPVEDPMSGEEARQMMRKILASSSRIGRSA